MPRKRQKWATVDVFCDGLCQPINPGGIATYGFAIYKGEQILAEDCGFIVQGEGATNNVAEYTAAIQALRWLKKNHLEKFPVALKSDSQLLIRQLNGHWRIKAPGIIPLYREAMELVRDFQNISFVWIPREENEVADALSRKAYVQKLEEARLERARKIDPSKIKPAGRKRYEVEGKSGRYVVDLSEMSCTCPDLGARREKIRCKHILAVLLSRGEIS